jgi:iron(III) transport system substrate-binding protein
MIGKRQFLFFAISLSILTLFTACTFSSKQASVENNDSIITMEDETSLPLPKTNTLVVYSSRNEKFVQPLLDKFENETGITVKALHAGETVINKIKEESKNVQADIFISNDIGALENLRLEGLLTGYSPKDIESIDERYRGKDNSWFALSARTRVFMYNKDRISEQEMPKTMWELTDPTWKGKFAITQGGNGSMIGHVSALRLEWGDEKTLEWLNQIKANAGAIMQGHGDIRRAVGSGEYAFGLVNNYYYHQQLQEPTYNNVGVIYTDQKPEEMGAVVNGAGVGHIHRAPNAYNAQLFLDWIVKPENQREFSYASLEVPINSSIETVGDAAKISDYKVHRMPLRDLGSVWGNTKSLIEESGLHLEIR